MEGGKKPSNFANSIQDLLSTPATVTKPSKPHITTFSFNDLLVGGSGPRIISNQYLQPQHKKSQPIIHKQPVIQASIPKTVIAFPPAHVIKTKTIQVTPPTNTVFQAPLPKAVEITSSDGDKWLLRCFCGNASEQGFMVQCDRCETWQHSKCVCETKTRVPEHYVCPICSQKHIRCSCDDNLDYTLPLIQCTKCKYFLHRQCEGLDIGPVDPSTYVCKRCGGTFQQLPDRELPPNIQLPNPRINLTKSMIERLHPNISDTPLYVVMYEKLVRKDLTLFHFLSVIYSSLRTYFYLTHQLCSFQTVRKRRTDLALSFFKCVFFVTKKLFGVGTAEVVALFDILVRMDLYKPSPILLNTYQPPIKPLEPAEDASDNAQQDFEKLKHLQSVSSLSLPRDLFVTPNGVFCRSNLQPEQLVCTCNGMVCLSDEFSYDRGIDVSQVVLFGTKFILDLSTDRNQIALNFRRSLTPNCILKPFTFKGKTYAGIFAGVADANGIDSRTRREKFSVPANTELTLPVDFPPGTLIEPIEYLSWHFDETESAAQELNSSPPQTPQRVSQSKQDKQDATFQMSARDERSHNREAKEAARRGRQTRENVKQTEKVEKQEKSDKEKAKPKKKGKNAKEEKESRTAKNAKRKGVKAKEQETDANDTFVFNLFKSEFPGEPIIEIYHDEPMDEYEEENDESNNDSDYNSGTKTSVSEKSETDIHTRNRIKENENESESDFVDEEPLPTIPDVPVDLSFLDEMRNVGDCSYVFVPPNDPTESFLEIIH